MSTTANEVDASSRAGSTLLGFPKGAWLIVSVEFWERFSFYTMMGLLALFLTGTTTLGGFGWSDPKALALVGFYSGAMYVFPSIGGWIADRVLGRRRAVTIGLILMFMGQLLFTAPYFLPLLLGQMRDLPLLETLHQLGVPLGYLFRPVSVDAALAASGAALPGGQGVELLTLAYALGAWGFYVAIACMIMGNALMKSTLVVLCGENFRLDDPKRDGAFAYYYLGICLGGVLSGLIAGLIAASLGWHYAFLVGAAGVALALIGYLSLGSRLLGSIGVAIEKPALVANADTTVAIGRGLGGFLRQHADRLILLFVLSLILLVFSAGWFQLYGTWTLFIERFVDRSVGSFTVPVPWFSSWNPAVVILFAPIVATLGTRLGQTGRAPDIVQKYLLALVLVIAGHVLMYWASQLAGADSKAPLWIPTVAIALTAIGELVAWTSTYGLVTRVAPPGYASATMGAWYAMTIGLGGYLSGFTGGWLEPLGYGGTFLAVAGITAVATLVTLALRGWLSRRAAHAGVTLT